MYRFQNSMNDGRADDAAAALWRSARVCIAKILSGSEINSLHTFLSRSICYDCAHVPLRRIMVWPAYPMLAIASKPGPGKSRSPATAGRAEAQAPQTPDGGD